MANDDESVEQQAQEVQSLTKYDDVIQPQSAGVDEVGPLYRVVGDTKIPVSKKRGAMWKQRMDSAKSAMSSHKTAWEEAIRYYQNDQMNKDTNENVDPNTSRSGRNTRETENVVFANVSAMVPLTFAKNPDAEFTATNEETREMATVIEKLVNKLSSMHSTPGINLKPKMKRAIVLGTLTNCAWIECGYTQREVSSDRMREEIEIISEKLVKAKTQQEIKECEGALLALDTKVDLLTPSGPWTKMRFPWDILIDPNTMELDLSDSNWAMVRDFIPTALLQALYAEKDAETKDWKSIYAPSHVIKASSDTTTDDVTPTDNFQLFKDSSPSAYGYKDAESLRLAEMTEVFYVWDRATRRCELYNAGNWKWPIWVWDDPYHLDRFFPIVPLQFHVDPVRLYAKGEVTYYLDQQDSLNEINSENKKMRQWASQKFIFNSNIVKDPSLIENYLSTNSEARSLGVDIPEGMKMVDMLMPMLTPSTGVRELFDKRLILEAIDRVSGVASVQRGTEYKTNTTNRAIDSYESQMQTRADEKIDAVETCIGDVLWITTQLILQFMTQDEVRTILGPEDAEKWRQLTPEEIRTGFQPRIVGGSTLKPTSRTKKEQAIQISQILGQFASATPMALLVALRVMTNAFNNDMIIEEKDWNEIRGALEEQIKMQQQQVGAQQQQADAQTTKATAMAEQGAEQTQQKGAQTAMAITEAISPTPGGGGAARSAPVTQEMAGPAEGIPGANPIQAIIGQAAQLIDQLPEDVKVYIGEMLASRMSVRDIVAEIQSRLSELQG